MRKYYYITVIFCIICFFLSGGIYAQQSFYFQDRLNWQQPRGFIEGQALLYFDGAVNHEQWGLLPAYHQRFPAEGAGNRLIAVIEESTWESLPMDDLSQVPDIELTGSDPQVIISGGTDRKKSFQSIYLLPLRKAADGEGFERMVEFRLSLQWEKDSAAHAAYVVSGRSLTESSVLQSGDWYRLAVDETGIHRIDYQGLVEMGIDPVQVDPRNIRIYGNGAGMLDESNAVHRFDDLRENAVYVFGEDDGIFDPQDYILFYGESPVKISYDYFSQKYVHEINLYTDRTYYFLTIGPGAGKRVQPGVPVSEEPTHEVSHFQDIAWHETDELNLIKSGKTWYGEVFKDQVEYSFPFDLPDIDLAEPVYLRVSMAGKSTTNTYIDIMADGEFVARLDVPSVVLGSTIYARPVSTGYEQFYAAGEQAEVTIYYEKPGPNDMAWLNYIELNFTRQLVLTNGQLSFRTAKSVGAGNISRFHIVTEASSLMTWDVTDPGMITAMLVEDDTAGFAFKVATGMLKEFIAFDGNSFLSPEFVERVENQNLHGFQPADFVIVTHPLFSDQANRLADHHRQADGMTTIVVTPQQIYNEFSSGAQDVSAIRDFMKMLYDRSENGDQPRYLLFFGDASYDYKGRIQPDHNFIPTYQSAESLKWAASFVTDDYFGCLDQDEGSNGSGTVDIGIGRFPVHTTDQAVDIVDKTLRYMLAERGNYGPWRNSICFVGDDEDSNIHLNQAEGLAAIADSLGPVYNISKIYLDAYSQLQTPSGTRYPDANAAINKTVEEGCLIINYTGHGGEIGWAGERVLDIPAIQSYKNISHMPAFVTATCEFSRYDDPSLVSAGELVIMNPEGAGIGLFTTTRLAYSQSNYALNKRFYNEVFNIDSLTGEYPRMGDLIRVSKTPSNQNIKNFVLLGNPALMLAYPRMKVRTLSIVNENQDRPVDTIHALSRITVKGQVEDLMGNKLSGFNGLLYPSVYDKPVLYKTRANDPASKLANFYMQDKLLYKGEISVIEGEFSFTFIVPVDISYQLGMGKISYYAVDTIQFIDAHGYDPVYIGGSDSLFTADDQGPEIRLYLNTMDFENGDITTMDPLLIALLTDESGINTVGNGIGHDIVAVIDHNFQMPVILNDYYVPEPDSYQKGEIRFRLGPFANGEHTLTLKAWDVFNNSSEQTITFQVNTGARLIISEAFTYPNPSSEGTYFVFSHNKPGSSFEVVIQVFNLMGQHVKTLSSSFTVETTDSVPVYWDGRDEGGNELSSGLYVYRLTVKSDDGFSAWVNQKLIRLRK